MFINLIVFILSMWHRYIYVDDAWFGEQALSFATNGYVKTETIPGILGWDQQLLVYHKLNIILGAGIIKLFGWSVYPLKFLTLTIYGLFFYIYYLFINSQPNRWKPRHFWLASFLIFVNPLMINLSFTYRPEILVMFLGFSSYFFLEKYLSKPSVKWLIISGITAGLAFFSHINGIIFIIAGFFLLIFQKKYKALFAYSLASILSASLYFFDLWQPGHFQIFLYQISHWPDNVGQNYLSKGILSYVWNSVIKLSTEHQRFFWSYKVSVFSGVFLICLFLFFKNKERAKKHRSLVFYTICLIICLNIFGSQIAERYLIYYYPFMALIVASMISDIELLKPFWNKTVRILTLLIVFVQICLVGYQYSDIFSRNHDYIKIHEKILSVVHPKDAKVLVPSEFVFNEIIDHQLVSYQAVKYYQNMHPKAFNPEIILKHLNKLGINYIIIDGSAIDNKHFNWFIGTKIRPNPYYKKFCKRQGFVILSSKEIPSTNLALTDLHKK